MSGEEVFPAVFYAAAFHSFSPLTLFDCERGREEKESGKGGQEVPEAFCTSLCVILYILEQERQEKKERRGGGQTFSGLSGIISQPPV